MNDFEIKDGVLIDYHGNESTVKIPEGVTHIQSCGSFPTFEHLILPESLKTVSPDNMWGTGLLRSITQHHIRIEVDESIWGWLSDFNMIQHIYEFLQNPESPEHQKYLKECIKTIFFNIDNETFQKILYTRKIFNDQKIDKYIHCAIDHQLYEKQIILMNYKAEHIGYDSIKDSIQKKFEL